MRKPISDFHSRSLPYLVNPSANKIIQNLFNSKFGGVQVVLASRGSCKTTFLRKFANQYIADGGHVQYYANETKTSKVFFLVLEMRREAKICLLFLHQSL